MTRWVQLRAYSPITGRPVWPEVQADRDNWAHGVWTALAVTLAEPLRKAYNEHCDWHGCGCRGGKWCDNPVIHEANGGHHVPGLAYCEEAQRLAGLLPAGDIVVYG